MTRLSWALGPLDLLFTTLERVGARLLVVNLVSAGLSVFVFQNMTSGRLRPILASVDLNQPIADPSTLVIYIATLLAGGGSALVLLLTGLMAAARAARGRVLLGAPVSPPLADPELLRLHVENFVARLKRGDPVSMRELAEEIRFPPYDAERLVASYLREMSGYESGLRSRP